MTLVQWLAAGGAYGALALTWLLAAVGYGQYAARLGRRYDAPNDGCLLLFACQMLLVIGGAVGLLLVAFPYNLLTAVAGAFLFPGLACLFFRRRMREWNPARTTPGKNDGDTSDGTPL